MILDEVGKKECRYFSSILATALVDGLVGLGSAMIKLCQAQTLSLPPITILEICPYIFFKKTSLHCGGKIV